MDAELTLQHYPKYATEPAQDVCQLGTGSNTVTATAIGVDGTADNAKTFYTFGPSGGVLESILISTDDTAAVNVLLYMLDGVKVLPLGIVNVPASSGNSATVPNVDAIAAILGTHVNAQGKKYLQGKGYSQVKGAVLANMTANKKLWISGFGLDFHPGII